MVLRHGRHICGQVQGIAMDYDLHRLGLLRWVLHHVWP
jgi:hypothetical protein